MKKMTCREMGGPCDVEIMGETAEEMMGNGKKHVHETADEVHQEIVKKMETMTEEDISSWKEGFMAKFASKPEA